MTKFRVIYGNNRKSQWFTRDTFHYVIHNDGDLTVHHTSSNLLVASFARYQWTAVLPHNA